MLSYIYDCNDDTQSAFMQLKRGPLLGALKLLVKHVPAGNLTVQRVEWSF